MVEGDAAADVVATAAVTVAAAAAAAAAAGRVQIGGNSGRLDCRAFTYDRQPERERQRARVQKWFRIELLFDVISKWF